MTAFNTFRNNSAEFLFHQKHLICSCKNTKEENYLDQNRFVKFKKMKIHELKKGLIKY